MATRPIEHPFELPGALRPANRWLARRSGGRRLHAGIDLRAASGTPVLAPERGEVVLVAEASYAEETPRFSAPGGWAGYGPLAVVLHGESGLFHLLAHMDRGHAPVLGEVFEEGATVGHVSAVARHLHWEVRARRQPPAGWATVEVTLDPVAWLRGEVRRYLDLDPRVCPARRWRVGDPLELRRLCPRACRVAS